MAGEAMQLEFSPVAMEPTDPGLTAEATTLELELEPADNARLARLCGQFDQNLHQLEERLGVEINNRGNRFRIIGDEIPVRHAGDILQGLYTESAQGELTPEQAAYIGVTVEGPYKSDHYRY